MLKSLFNLFKKEDQSKSPIVRDTLRRLSGTKDDSITGKAIQSTEAVMAKAMTLIGDDLLNENDATREASIYFITGTAIGYCYKYGTQDFEDIRAVVRCTMRLWCKNPAGADHLADNLSQYLDDEDFAGPVIDSAAEAVSNTAHNTDDVVGVFNRTLHKWRSFDIESHDRKYESANAL